MDHFPEERERPDTEDELKEQLVTQIDAGFAELTRRYWQRLYRLALRIAANRHDAEDLVAETLLRTWRSLSTYPASRIRVMRIWPWLVTVLMNVWRNEIRRRNRRPAEVPLVVKLLDVRPGAPWLVEQAVLRAEAHEELGEMLRTLPTDHRRAVVMRYGRGDSIADIAAALRCPEGTAKSKALRGLHRLRRRYADQAAGA
ncbi:sigma-70 family RNA polymerase sigma factor [Longispora sp. NPDC051575]|uniref:RNA polymerase sigma factor n=1 Tax=Longispora sp. NPDC051575 TaxID=3154943 RepID=UPI00343C1A40